MTQRTSRNPGHTVQIRFATIVPDATPRPAHQRQWETTIGVHHIPIECTSIVGWINENGLNQYFWTHSSNPSCEIVVEAQCSGKNPLYQSLPLPESLSLLPPPKSLELLSSLL
jgi:hypothetical protein